MGRLVHHHGRGLAGVLVILLAASVTRLNAQIGSAAIDQHKGALERQTTDPDQKREGGTQPRDWEYRLADGVGTRQVTFYVDGGVPLYGKLFLPKGFTSSGKYPAVVVGHGINALSIGIEKFAARFAERGLVAMAIDYQSYGFSGSGSDDIRLLEPDATTDDRPVAEHVLRILLKRTNLNNAHEVNDFRAAISFLQGGRGRRLGLRERQRDAHDPIEAAARATERRRVTRLRVHIPSRWLHVGPDRLGMSSAVKMPSGVTDRHNPSRFASSAATSSEKSA